MRLSTIEWIAPDGTVLSLNSRASGVVLTDPPEGLIMPPPLFTSSPVFNRPGQTLEQATFDVRTITVHLAVIGDSLDDFTVIYGYIASLFNPRAGMGMLRITRDDGTQRVIACAYTSGLEGVVPIGDDSNVDVWAEADVQFSAFDPYFLDPEVTEINNATEGNNPWFPLDLASGLDLSRSSLFSDVTITNGGDDLAWPVWTITGPAQNPLLLNDTSGGIIDLSSGLGLQLIDASESLVIDTFEGTILKTIADGSVSNEWAALTAESDLWPLVGGDNVLHVVMTGSSGATTITAAYRLRWLTI